MKKYTLITFFLLLSITCFSQITVTGSVQTIEDGERMRIDDNGQL